MANHHTLMRRIAWTIIAILLSIEVAVAIDATAQVRRLRRGRLALPQQRQEKANSDVTKDLAQNVLEIARSVSDQAEDRMVDLVFVIDGSRGMVNAIAEIRRELVDVAGVFEED